jgi:hypothetical protein
MGYSFTFHFSENDIDFSPRSDRFFNYHKFLINEFFNATDDEMVKIMTTYQRMYGQSAFNYVLKNYYWGWRHGNRTLSNVQENRIISIMPEHLNESAKQRLNKIREEARYKLGIEEILSAIKRTVQSFFSVQSTIHSKEKILSADDIISIFEKEVERAKHFLIPQQTSRFGTDNIIILTEDEKNEALKIAQYIVFVKLQKQFNKIEKDFNTFLPFMKSFRRGVFHAFYSITSFNLRIELTNAKFEQVTIPHLNIKEIEANSRFKQYSDKYLAYELVNIYHETGQAIANSFLNHHDIKVFFDQYEELSKSDNEINMKSTFNGEGGILNIDIKMKPIKMLKTSIARSVVKILIYTIIIAGLVSWVCVYKIWALLVIGGLYGGGFYISLVAGEIKEIKTFKTELKLYGQ